ncbi:MAG: hypothetical protein QNJ00_12400 [Woeseiaceae bacterium]|nr:hypothetical protein [Woeseiaceae bacterium]
MLRTSEIPWLRILAEGTAIVVSILLAFAIDAWWQERTEADQERAQLEALLAEFVSAREHLQRQACWLEDSLGGTLGLLAQMGPEAEPDPEQAGAALGRSLNIGIGAPEHSTLQDLLASRGRTDFGTQALWSSLQAWPTMLADLETDGRNLERSREEDFVGAVVRLGVPLLALIEGRPQSPGTPEELALPRSSFEANWSVLLRDPGVETVFAMRALRMQLLLSSHSAALDHLDTIVEALGGEPNQSGEPAC